MNTVAVALASADVAATTSGIIELVKKSGMKLFVDPDRKRARVDGVPVRFSRTEWEFWRFFAANAGRFVGKTQIHEGVYGQKMHDDGNRVKVHLSHIRKKLDDTKPNAGSFFQSRYGTGYKLAGD